MLYNITIQMKNWQVILAHMLKIKTVYKYVYIYKYKNIFYVLLLIRIVLLVMHTNFILNL